MLQRILPVYFIVFLGYIGYSLFLTTFAPALLHGDLLQWRESTRVILLGVLIFLYPFGQFLSSPILGALSDRFGRRPLFLYSLCVTTIVYLFIGICLIKLWIFPLMIGLFIAGLSEGNVTIAQSAVADLSDERTRHRLFGYIYLASSCSYLVGPVMAGWLANRGPDRDPAYYLPFFVVAGMLAVCLIWTFLSFKETARKQVHVSYIEGFTNIKNLFILKGFRIFFLVNFVLYMVSFGFLQGFPIYVVARYKVEVGLLSKMIAWTDIPFIIVNLCLIAYLAKRFKVTKLLSFMALLLGTTMLLMLIPTEKHALWPMLIVCGFSVAVILPLTASLVSLKASPEQQGRVLGVNQSLNFFTEAASGLVVALLAAAYVKLAFLIFALFGFLAALLLLKLRIREKREV